MYLGTGRLYCCSTAWSVTIKDVSAECRHAGDGVRETVGVGLLFRDDDDEDAGEISERCHC